MRETGEYFPDYDKFYEKSGRSITMRESFDVVILGCGEAGIFAAYELEN